MTVKIIRADIFDIRFETSRLLDGSDALNHAPDYSAAYLTLHTNVPNLIGHGFTFTLGRGNNLCVLAIREIIDQLLPISLEATTEHLGDFWHKIVHLPQLRWLGPEKGVLHLATAAIINTIWDLWARYEQKPLWKLIIDLEPWQLVNTIDFSYLHNVLTKQQAILLLQTMQSTKVQRENDIKRTGYPAYNTSVGWMGYSIDKLKQLSTASSQQGWKRFKLKIGRNVNENIMRCKAIRDTIGNEAMLMLDANQVWEVDEALIQMNVLKKFNPYWIEEPTNPDDIIAHKIIRENIYPIKVVSGEQCHNRIMFKQFLQMQALDAIQIDCCRLGGISEALAVLLMAAKYKISVCPHAGGVGLCEYMQHLSIVDYIAVSGTLQNRFLEYVDLLHEHFIHPVIIKDGNYVVPTNVGSSIEMTSGTMASYIYDKA